MSLSRSDDGGPSTPHSKPHCPLLHTMTSNTLGSLFPRASGQELPCQPDTGAGPVWPRCKRARPTGRPRPTPHGCPSWGLSRDTAVSATPESRGTASVLPLGVPLLCAGRHLEGQSLLCSGTGSQGAGRRGAAHPRLQQAHALPPTPAGNSSTRVQPVKGLPCSLSLGAHSSHGQSAPGTSGTPHSLPDGRLQEDSGGTFSGRNPRKAALFLSNKLALTWWS